MHFECAQYMNATATNLQIHWEASAGFNPAVRAEGASSAFDFARVRQERPVCPARYVILLRRRHADRARFTWALRSLTN